MRDVFTIEREENREACVGCERCSRGCRKVIRAVMGGGGFRGGNCLGKKKVRWDLCWCFVWILQRCRQRVESRGGVACGRRRGFAKKKGCEEGDRVLGSPPLLFLFYFPFFFLSCIMRER